MSISSKPSFALFEEGELARLAERARLDAHSGVKGEPRAEGDELGSEDGEADSEDGEAQHARETARLLRGLTGLRCAARAYAVSRDPRGLTPAVWAAWAVHARPLETQVDAADLLASAVTSVGDRVWEVAGLAQRLAASDVTAVRLALANALTAGGEGEPILRAFASDPDPAVRAAARAKVSLCDPWEGAFPIAPDGHPHHVLVAARAVLELSWYERGRDPERAVRAFAPLSDALAVPCWERVLSPEHVGREALRAWLPCLVERPGGGAALARLVTLWDRRGDAVFAVPCVAEAQRLPDEARARAFWELLVSIAEHEERAADDAAQPYLRQQIADVACTLAPERGDARALLSVILGGPIDTAAEEPGAFDHSSSKLSEVLARWPLDRALRSALVGARRAGQPGRWARVSRQVWDRLGPDPVLRRRARRELDAEDDRVRASAVYALLGPLHDRKKDGTVLAAARRLYRRPELRRAVIQRSDGMLRRARGDLERGRLRIEEAIVVLAKTPAAEQTDAMWSAARALRDRAAANGEKPLVYWAGFPTAECLVRMGDGWDPSDLAYVRAVVSDALSSEGGGALLRFLIGVIERMDGPESVELLAQIDAGATTQELREHVAAGRRMSEPLRPLER